MKKSENLKPNLADNRVTGFIFIANFKKYIRNPTKILPEKLQSIL